MPQTAIATTRGGCQPVGNFRAPQQDNRGNDVSDLRGFKWLGVLPLLLRRFVGIVLVLGAGSVAVAGDLPPFPKHVPPIVATAVVADPGKGGESSEWRIGLTIPRIQWEIVGKMTPKEQWPQLRAQVEKINLVLVMGGPSQLAESRFLYMKGEQLSRNQVRRRLEKETPVIVSLSGGMPDAYFLQLTNAEALIVVLGPRDGFPAPEFLPAKKEAATKSQVEGVK